MNRYRSALFLALAAAAAGLGALPAQGPSQQLWSNPWSNYTTVRSNSWSNPISDIEAADDFDVQGVVRRVVFDGNGCFQCTPPVVGGVTVRFYAWANGVPGALQQQTYLAAGSAGLRFDPLLPETVEVTLPAPFVATGRHFVSMQVHFVGSGYWSVWSSSVGNQRLAPVQIRDRLGGTPWTQAPISPVQPQPLYADLTFQLHGQPAGSAGTTWMPCVTWSETPTAMPPGANHCLLRAVKSFGPNDVWAAGSKTVPALGGYDEHTVAMHWNGDSWTQVPSPNPAPAPGLANLILYGLDGVATDDLWAAGTYQTQIAGGWVGQQVFAMHWNGSSWTVPSGLPVPVSGIGGGVSGSSIQGVKATASDDVWFVGDWLDLVSIASGQVIRPGFLMHWDGSGLAQTVLPIVTGVGHQFFSAVDAAAANDVWVVGGAGLPGNPQRSAVPVVFHFDGSNWTHRPCAVPNLPGATVNLTSVDVLPSGHVIVGGAMTSPGTPFPQITYFLSQWDGSTWTVLPGPPSGGSVRAVSPWEIYAVGNDVWQWNGVQWSQTHSFGTAGAMNAIDALGPCEVFAVGGQTVIGQIAPFAARIDHPSWPHTLLRLPTLPTLAPATLTSLSLPRLGMPARVAIDDPSGSIGSTQGIAFWVVAGAPAVGWPAPVPYPLGGSGGPGEVFLDLASVGHTSPAALWTAGTPCVQSVAIPATPNVLGVDLYTQGALFGLSSGAIRFTNGLDLHIGL